MEDLDTIRHQAATYREMAPYLDRLQKLVRRRGWPLGINVLQCAVEELERLTDKAEAQHEKAVRPLTRSMVAALCELLPGPRHADDFSAARLTCIALLNRNFITCGPDRWGVYAITDAGRTALVGLRSSTPTPNQRD